MECGSIFSYIEKAKTKCKQNKNDGIVFVLTCHGYSNNVIFDSSGTKIKLKSIFDQFNGENCVYLIDKPKIFIIDCCRGKDAAKPIEKKEEESKNDKENELGADVKGCNYNYNGNEMIKLKNISVTDSQSWFHGDSNFAFIYSNTDGYATLDGSRGGGYLIRSIKKVFSNTDFICQFGLDSNWYLQQKEEDKGAEKVFA